MPWATHGRPAVIIASGCLVNVVLDIIFVAVLHMEALGCGIAVALTICSNATMIVLRMMRAPVHGVFRCLGSASIAVFARV